MRAAASFALALSAAAIPLAAQEDSAQARPVPAAAVDSALEAQRQRGDSVRPRPPISPTGAFLRSLVLPGWGQSRLNRNVTAGLFISFEALAATMVWKSQWQLDFARVRGKYERSHQQEREDWIVLLVFNHLMAGAEAYVSAHLWDFPGALRIRAAPLPGGGAGLLVSVPLR
jgi:hypothetical protein